MPRARNLKPGFFKNEVLAKLPAMARLLFAGLWLWADRDGRLEDRPERIRGEIFPYEQVDVDDILNQLSAQGFIVRYQVGRARVIQISSWKKHGSPYKNEPSYDLPEPPLELLEQVETNCNTFEHSRAPEVGKKKQEKGSEEEGEEAIVLVEPVPLSKVAESAAGLAQEFSHRFRGKRIAAEHDPVQMTPMMEFLVQHFTVAEIRAEIYRPGRDRNENDWKFKKRFEDRLQPARASPDLKHDGIKDFLASGDQ